MRLQNGITISGQTLRNRPMLAAGRAAALIMVAMLALQPTTASAQAYPSRPITLIVPFPAGGPADIGTRIIMQKMSDNLGQAVVVDNRAGAGGQIGANSVKAAAPDGYTLYLANIGTHAINRTLYTKLSYDPVKDFTAVSLMFSLPHVLVVPPDSPAKSVKDLVALAKEQPGKLSFASQGVGSGGHLLGEMFKSRMNVDVQHVAYRGTAQALPDLLAGRVQFFFDGIPGAGPLVTDGKLRGLAITDHARSAMLPDVPTMAEAGFPNFELSAWFGVSAPAGTPRPIVDKLHAEIVKAIRNPETEKKLQQYAIKSIASSPEEFMDTMEKDAERLGKVVKESGARMD